MKKIIAFAFVAMLSITSAYAQDVDKFMEKYKELVTNVEKFDNKKVDNKKLEQYKKQYEELTEEVDKYKDDMTSDELKEYYKYKARYQKKLAAIKTKRGVSTAIGWAKGVLGKD